MDTKKKTTRWNERYSQEEYAFGTDPNEYIKEQLPLLVPGKILFPADGEGRNGVYAAKLGWEVFCFDLSIEGKKKAVQLADKNRVKIDYQVGDLHSVNFQENQFDAVALIYAHFSKEDRELYYAAFDRFLKNEGYFIIEVFSKKHIDYVTANEKVGGPREPDLLLSEEEIKKLLPNYEIIALEETEVDLKEGLYHIGKGSVIRFVGKKKTKPN